MSESPLRRHIDALLADNPGAVSAELQRWLAPTSESQVEQIAVEQIHDREWRGEVDTADPAYRALKASVRASGVLQPLLLRPRPEGGFEVVAGVRRLRATRETGQATVPAVVRELGDLAAIVGGAWETLSRTGITMAEARALTARLQSAGMAKAESVALVATLPRVALPAGEPPPAQSHRAAPTPRGGPADEDLPAVPVVGRVIGQHPPEAMSVEPAREVVPVEPTAAAEEMSTPTAVLERAPEAAAPDALAATDMTDEDVTPEREDGSSAEAEPTATVGSAADVAAAVEPQAGEASDDAGPPAVVAPQESPPSTHAPIVISISTPGDEASEAGAVPEPESPHTAAPDSPPVTAPDSEAAEQAWAPFPALPPAPAPQPPTPPQMSARAPGRSRLPATRQPATALPAASQSPAPADADGLGNPLWYTPYALGVAVGALVFLILSIQQGETGRPLIASAVVMAVALLLAMASLALARRHL